MMWPIVLVMSLAIAAKQPGPQHVFSQGTKTSTYMTEIVPYGGEQALVDAIIKRRERYSHQEYANELDHVLAVLLQRAHPIPMKRDLIQPAVESLCSEIQTRTQSKISSFQQQVWINEACQTESFEPVLNALIEIAANRVPREQLVDAGLVAMLCATAPKTAGVLNIPETQRIEETLAAREMQSNEVGFLGVDVSQWPMIKVVPGSPAAEAGLQDGDLVVRVNSSDVAETERPADGLEALTGPPDTSICLTVLRNGTSLEFQVLRKSARQRINATAIGSDIFYIQITSFEAPRIAARVDELVRQHVTDSTAAVILDVRDNIGGRAEEANAVADIFLDDRCLQIFLFRNGRRIAFQSKPGALDVPVIVLTNQNTGSAAEMLAIALHDNHRATVIGQQTAGALFGKDFEKLTDGRMFIFRSEPTILSPKGIDYTEIGLAPDIKVYESTTSGDDGILARAIRFAHRRKQ